MSFFLRQGVLDSSLLHQLNQDIRNARTWTLIQDHSSMRRELVGGKNSTVMYRELRGDRCSDLSMNG